MKLVSTLNPLDEIDREIIADLDKGIDPTQTAKRLGVDWSEVYERMIRPAFRIARLESTARHFATLETAVHAAAEKGAASLIDDIESSVLTPEKRLRAKMDLIRLSIELKEKHALATRVAAHEAALGDEGAK